MAGENKIFIPRARTEEVYRYCPENRRHVGTWPLLLFGISDMMKWVSSTQQLRTDGFDRSDGTDGLPLILRQRNASHFQEHYCWIANNITAKHPLSLFYALDEIQSRHPLFWQVLCWNSERTFTGLVSVFGNACLRFQPRETSSSHHFCSNSKFVTLFKKRKKKMENTYFYQYLLLAKVYLFYIWVQKRSWTV